MLNKLFLFSILSISLLVQAADKSVLSLSAPFAPEGERNGYLGSANFKYGLRVCDKEVFLALVASYNVEPTLYRYNGKIYKPADLGLTSFDKTKLLNVTKLTANLYRAETSIGQMSLNNVPSVGGVSCLGEAKRIKEQISSFDEEAAKKQLDIYSLRSGKVLSTVSDYDIESIIKKKEAKEAAPVAPPTTKKAAQAQSKAQGTKQEVTKKAEAKKIKTKQVAQSTPASKSQTKKSLDANTEMRKANKATQRKVKAAERQGKQVSSAAKSVADVASGIASSGIALGVGTNRNEEDNTLLINLVFAKWDFPWNEKVSNKFWSGTMTYFSFEYDEYVEPTKGAPISAGEDKFTKYMLGINFLNNSLGLDYIQPLWGFSYNFIQEYDQNGNPEDSLGGEFGIDYGLALVLVDKLLVTWTRNTAAESDAINFVFTF